MPLLVPGQAGKEITHNEALMLLDLAVQPVVVAIGSDESPATALPGQAWIVGRSPTGSWTGHADALASWTGGGWRFVAPFDGLQAWCVSDAKPVTYRDGLWQDSDVTGARLVIDGHPVVGKQAGAIADPVIGTGIVDDGARNTLIAILSALRQHGLIAR